MDPKKFLERFGYDLLTLQFLKDDKPYGYGVYVPFDYDSAIRDCQEKNSQGADCYYMANGGDGKKWGDNVIPRSKKNVIELKVCFTDADGCTLEVMKRYWNSLGIRPHIIVETSPGHYHIYFFIESEKATPENIKKWVAVQTMMSHLGDLANNPKELGLDLASAKDCSRLLRIPGFFHVKKNHLVKIIEWNEHNPYSLDQLFDLTSAAAALPSEDEENSERYVLPEGIIPKGCRHNELIRYLGHKSHWVDSREALATAANSFIYRHLEDPEGFLREDKDKIPKMVDSAWATRQQGSTREGLLKLLPDETNDFSWPNIIPFADDHGPEIPCNLIPGVIGEFAAELARATETPPSLAAMVSLGCVSTAANGKYIVRVPQGWDESVNIYTVIALQPGSRKSPVFRACLKPIEMWDRDQRGLKEEEVQRREAERLTTLAIIKRKRDQVAKAKDEELRKSLSAEVVELSIGIPLLPVIPRSFTTDATPEALAHRMGEQGGRFAVLSDEAGVVEVMGGLYSEGKANLDIYLKGWDGGFVRIDRCLKTIECNPYLTVVLTIQPKIVSDMGERKALQGNGLMERFLWVIPRSNLGERSNRAPKLSASLEIQYANCLRDILGFKSTEPIVLTLDAHANQEFLCFRDAIEAELKPAGTLREVSGWGSKLPGQAIRLAGLLHICEYGANCPSFINKKTLLHALEIASLLRWHALIAFSILGSDTRGFRARRLAEYLPPLGLDPFTATQLREAVKNVQCLKGENLEEAVKELQERGYLCKLPRPFQSRGKTTTWYQLNPSLISPRKPGTPGTEDES